MKKRISQKLQGQQLHEQLIDEQWIHDETHQPDEHEIVDLKVEIDHDENLFQLQQNDKNDEVVENDKNFNSYIQNSS